MRKQSQTPRVRRYISIFPNDNEFMVGEIELVRDDLPILQKIFRESQSNPMYDCYKITVHEEKALHEEGMLLEKLDFQSYHYFLEASTF